MASLICCQTFVSVRSLPTHPSIPASLYPSSFTTSPTDVHCPRCVQKTSTLSWPSIRLSLVSARGQGTQGFPVQLSPGGYRRVFVGMQRRRRSARDIMRSDVVMGKLLRSSNFRRRETAYSTVVSVDSLTKRTNRLCSYISSISF